MLLSMPHPLPAAYSRSSALYAHLAPAIQVSSSDLTAPYQWRGITESGALWTVRLSDVAADLVVDPLDVIARGASLSRSSDYDRLAVRALANAEANRRIDVQTWAEALARDVAGLTD